jgi:hypothetical protein
VAGVKVEVLLTLRYLKETAEKEVQDISCRESGGVLQLQQSPKTGGYRGLIKAISTFY